MRSRWTSIISTSLNVILASALALLVAGDWNHESPPTPQMESLEIVDADGKARIVLAVEDDTPTLRMFDQHQRVRIELSVRPTWNVLGDRSSLAPDSEPTVRLFHADGEDGLELSLTNGDLPWLDMYDDQQNDVVSLGLNSYNAPSLEMSDSAYKRHVDIRFDEEGYYGLAVYDPEYADLVRAGVTSDGSPAVQLFGDDEQRLASFEIESRRPRLGFWDLDNALVYEVSSEAATISK